jgi:hypothetical protein
MCCQLFGLSSPVFYRILNRVTRAILQVSRAGGPGVKWPTEDEKIEVIRGFQAIWGLPNCSGAIDCTHILMTKPQGEIAIDWVDRKSNVSMVIQAIVDSRCKFIDLSIGKSLYNFEW